MVRVRNTGLKFVNWVFKQSLVRLNEFDLLNVIGITIDMG